MRKLLIAGAAVLVVAGVGGYFGLDYYANAKLAERAEVFARDMRRFTREFRYGSVEASVLGASVVMRDVEMVTLTGDRVRIKRVALSDFDWRSRGAPRYADFAIEGAEVPSSMIAALANSGGAALGQFLGIAAPPPGNSRRLLDRAGYGRATGNLRVKYRYDEAAREFEVREIVVDVADFGTLTFTVKLGNVPRANLDRPEEMIGAGLQVTLAHAALRFRDRALVSRLLKAYSAGLGVSEAQALERILRELRGAAARADDSLERESLEALAAFIERPGEIGIALEPVRPVPLVGSMMRVFGGRAFKHTFGLRISAR